MTMDLMKRKQDGLWRSIGAAADGLCRRANEWTCGLWCRMSAKLSSTKGQGTTEYAILVGVLVVIAIVAISVFRPKIQSLWDAIANGINSL